MRPSLSSSSRSPTRLRSGDARSPQAILAALRRGELVYDRIFDDLFPLEARRASSVHWTPVEIAVRAARLLTEGVSRPVVLDVGAGVGKFCTIAAATVGGAIRGVEHRAHFVAVARAAAQKLGVDVSFSHGTIADADFTAVTGIYLFNPFAENLAPAADHLDETVSLGEVAFWRDVAAVERYLEGAPVGTRVVTYCGWGGTIPDDYELVLREGRAGTLELWRRGEPLRRPAKAKSASRHTLADLHGTVLAAGRATTWDERDDRDDGGQGT